MRLSTKLFAAVVAACALAAGAPALAQQKLKWAHVYETSEPYHTESVWAAAEIKKRTNGKFDIEVFPASTLGKETDINQGLALGTVDMIISGPSFAARSYPRIGIAYYPFIFRDGDHLIAYSKSPIFAEMVEEFRKKTGIQITAYTYYGARQTTAQLEARNGLAVQLHDERHVLVDVVVEVKVHVGRVRVHDRHAFLADRAFCIRGARG